MSYFVRVATLFSVVFLISCNTKQEVRFKEGSMQEAIEESQKLNKTLVAMVSKHECSPCEYLPNDISTNFDKEIDPSNYLFYKIESDQVQNEWVNQWLYDLSFPTTCIISPNGKLITTITNGKYECFLDVLKQIDRSKNDSIYVHTHSYLKLKNKELIYFLDQILQTKLAEFNKNNLSSTEKKLMSSIAKQSYFYNNYLLSKYYNNCGDTLQAKLYANKALEFTDELDAILYTSLRTEMNYILSKNFKLSDEPYMAVKNIEQDLGSLEVGNEGEAIFSIINKGEKPLLIHKIGVSCKCTSVDWSRKPVPPGESTIIKARFKVERAGVFHQGMRVFSNAYNGPVILSVKARVF